MAMHKTSKPTKGIKLKSATSVTSTVSLSDLTLQTSLAPTDLVPFSKLGTPNVSSDITLTNFTDSQSAVINAIADASPPQNSDKFAMIRSGEWITITWSEILSVIESGELTLQQVWDAIGAATPGSPIAGDLVTLIRNVGGVQTPETQVIENFYQDISDAIYFSPYAAKVATVAQWNAAIAASASVIYVSAEFSFDQNVTLLVDTSVYVAPNLQINMGIYQINQNNNVFRLECLSNFSNPNNGWGYVPVTPGNSPFINTPLADAKKRDEHGNYVLNEDGSNKLSSDPSQYIPLVFINCRMGNSGSVANTPVSQTNKQIYNNSWVFAGNADNAGVNLSISGSNFNNLTILLSSALSTNALVVADNCATGMGLAIYNQDVIYADSLITIGQGNQIYGIWCYGYTGGGNLPIISKGQIYNLNGSKCTPVLTMDGQSPVLDGSNLAAGSITVNVTAVNPKIVASNATGTFTQNSTTYQGALNTGTITNTTQSSSGLSPFSAVVDGVGALPNHYATVGAAYAAGKTELYTTANITETANIAMNPADQLYVRVGQGFTWDLGVYSIVGSFSAPTEDNPELPTTTGSNTFTLELTDGSAIFKWGNPTAGLPISNFDDLSTVTIRANGGVLQNISTVANTYLYCAGTFLADGAILLLPDASAGGIKTDNYTKLTGLELTGGGTACDTALICEGGSVRDTIIDGSFTDNSTIVQSNSDTIYDGIGVNLSTNNNIQICGKASKILSTNPAGFLISQIKQSLDTNGNTSLSDSTVDQCSIPTAVTRVQVSNCTIGLLDPANDNTTQADFVNTTFLNEPNLYGDSAFVNCRFNASFAPQDGATLSFSSCKSSAAITSWGTATKTRAANDTNIGNDY